MAVQRFVREVGGNTDPNFMSYEDACHQFREWCEESKIEIPLRCPKKDRKRKRLQGKGQWFFWTLNNPSLEELDQIGADIKFRYKTGNFEQGESGTPHLQMTTWSTNPTTLASVATRYPRASIRLSRAPERAIEYVTKEATRVAGPFEDGERPHQGLSGGLLAMGTAIAHGADMREVAMQDLGLFARHHRGLAAIAALTEPIKSRAPDVYFIAPEDAPKLAGSYYVTSEWFNTYTGQDTIVIYWDSIRPSHYPWLISLLGPGPCHGKVHFGMKSLYPEFVFIVKLGPTRTEETASGYVLHSILSGVREVKLNGD